MVKAEKTIITITYSIKVVILQLIIVYYKDSCL